MGKAYSEEEKNEIRTRLMEEGIKLFHENGSRTLSIRELTRRAGIAQGGFYSFYKDKDSLIRDIVSYRGAQKVRIIEETLPESLHAPMEYLVSGCIAFILDLVQKAKSSQMYADALDLVLRDMADACRNRKNESGNVKNGATDSDLNFLDGIFAYWRQNGYDVKVDEEGLDNLFAAAFVLGRYGECIDERYREQEIKLLLQAGLENYVEVKKK